MILFSLLSIESDFHTMYIAYMEKGKEFLSVDFYLKYSEEWKRSAMSGKFTPVDLIAWLQINYPNHEIYHMEIP